VDDRIRFKLIRALIDAIRSFRQVRNVKVLVSGSNWRGLS
jgi:hypothetical protein